MKRVVAVVLDVEGNIDDAGLLRLAHQTLSVPPMAMPENVFVGELDEVCSDLMSVPYAAEDEEDEDD